MLRVIREPCFGRIGRVVELPSELRQLETESEARVVEFADDSRLGAGSHVVTLGEGRRRAPGVYLLRLSQGARSLTARGAILR